jgi:C1A family cysteine protease
MLRTRHHAHGGSTEVHLGGWRKQLNDLRDEPYRVKLPGSFLVALPTSCDQRGICSPIEDQGALGSCTANAFAGIIEANERRAAKALMPTAKNAQVAVSNINVSASGIITFLTTVTPPPAPAPTPTPTPAPTPAPKTLIEVSRLFEYYATRKIEGTTGEDSGATIRDTIKAGAQYGIINEKTWPYNVSQFAVNPPSDVWTAAASHKITSYHAITDGDLATMKSVIVSGYLVEFGFTVYDYFLTADMAAKGFLPLPGRTESVQGGHAVDLVGYDDNMISPFNTASKGAFLVRNSWGTGWGVSGSGYFWMSYDYVKNTSLCSDFWVVQSSPV